MNKDGQTSMGVMLPNGMIEEIDKLVHIEGMFLSRSDALRHGARLVLLLRKDIKNLEELRKEARDKL